MIQESLEKEISEARKIAEKYLLSKFNLNYFDIQDVLQNTSIKACKNISSFKKESSFNTWYISIARNEALTILFKKKKSKEVEDTENLLINYSDSWIEPEINDCDKIQEIKNVINNAIKSLSVKHKEVLQLMLENSFSYREISSKLNIPINSVRTRFFYAKKTLRKIISSYAFNSRT